MRGFENGDTLSSIDVLPTLTPDISTFTSAGVYPFYFANGTDNYYELVSDTADFIVNKRMLSVAADTVTMTFGDPLPPFTYRITGFAGTDNESVLDVPPVASTNAARGSLPGCTRSMWRVARTRIIILNIPRHLDRTIETKHGFTESIKGTVYCLFQCGLYW